MTFSELKLRPSLLEALTKLNFQNCTPIQESVIPVIQDGKDVFGLAQTGTGKTAAFLLPLMERILCSRQSVEGLDDEAKELVQKRAYPDWKPKHFVLILTPTRELAEQIGQDVQRLGDVSGLRSVAIYGGSSYEPQKAKLEEGVEFVIGTPGRLIDLYKTHALDLRQIRAVVFDEADRMFDMGFKDDMKYLLQRIPKERQMLMFSATLNFDVLTTAYQFGSEPIEINVSLDQAKAENVKDFITHIGQEEKPKFLLSILKKENPKQTIIFSNFKHNVERIAHFLNQNGLPAVAISSLLTQAQRNRVLEQFKSDNDRNILVATDVAARGLDIKGVDLVINYELPDDAENYVHRIGRTGRAGAEGKAFSLVSDRDVDALSRIEEYLKHKVDAVWLEDTDLVKEFKSIGSGAPERPRFAQSESAGHGGGGRSSSGPRRSGPGGGRGGPGGRSSGPTGGRGGASGRGSDRGGRSGERHESHQSAGGTGANSAGGLHRDRQLGRHANPTRSHSGSSQGSATAGSHGERSGAKAGARGGASGSQTAGHSGHGASRGASGGAGGKRHDSKQSSQKSSRDNGRRFQSSSSGGASKNSKKGGVINKVTGFIKGLLGSSGTKSKR